MPAYDILCIGDVNIDLILSGLERLPEFGEEVLAQAIGTHLGGCTANVAVFAARLGMRSALRARVGRDDFGDFLIGELEKVGVATEFIIRDEELATGITVSLSGREDRAFVTYLGTIDSLRPDDVSDDLLRSARHIHVGSFFMQRKLKPGLSEIMRRAREQGLSTSLDTGYDPYEEWDGGIREVLRHVSVFAPNEVEVTRITGVSDAKEAARGLAQLGPQVALKLGAEGSALYEGGEEIGAPAFGVEVVDTTCCGDAFNAGFLCAMLEGKAPQECLRWGNAAGAIVAGASGASAPRLGREEVQRMVGEGSL